MSSILGMGRSSSGDTQLFIGIYERSGLVRIEEAYAKRPGESVIRAMAWGAGRGRALALYTLEPKQHMG
jgi:hypothetical protein